MSPEVIARVMHEVLRAHNAVYDNEPMPSWEDAPAWQKASSHEAVRFHLEHPDAQAHETHEAWLKQREDDGWTYGPTKDSIAKTHPCLVPYEQLPNHEKAKDHIVAALVKALST